MGMENKNCQPKLRNKAGLRVHLLTFLKMGFENKIADPKFRDNAGFGPLNKLFYKWALSEIWAMLKLKLGVVPIY